MSRFAPTPTVPTRGPVSFRHDGDRSSDRGTRWAWTDSGLSRKHQRARTKKKKCKKCCSTSASQHLQGGLERACIPMARAAAASSPSGYATPCARTPQKRTLARSLPNPPPDLSEKRTQKHAESKGTRAVHGSVLVAECRSVEYGAAVTKLRRFYYHGDNMPSA